MSVSVFDVATYILEKMGPIPALKLQKLVYYSQAWSLVWDDASLFKEKIEAWANGPVVRELFNEHRGQYEVKNISRGSAEALNKLQKETIDGVINYYGSKNSQWLSDLTHMEAPWQIARKGLEDDQPSDREITLESMSDYYQSIQPDEDSHLSTR